MIAYIQKVAAENGITREIPIHILVETHGALHEAYEIAALPWLQVLDFGLMDFVSGHYGAIPGSAMRSPGQFEHRLLARAKANVQIRMLWIVCGADDGLLGVNRAFEEWLKAKNVKFTSAEVPGFAHVWPLWRQNLTEMAPLLFQAKK